MTALLLTIVFLFQQMQFNFSERSSSAGELPPARKEIVSKEFATKPVLRVGGEEAEYLMGSQRLFPIYMPNGELFLGDSQMNHIKVFNAQGKLTQEIGRQGDGPGEFQGMMQMRFFEDKIYVLDMRFRINVFDAKTKKHLTTVTIGGSTGTSPMAMGRMGFPMDFFPVKDGFYLVMNTPVMAIDGKRPEVPAEGVMIKKADLNGAVSDEPILKFRSMETAPIQASAGRIMVMNLPFGKRTLLQFDRKNNQLLAAWSGDFEISRYDFSGEKKGSIKEDVAPTKISQKDIDAWLKASGQDKLPEGAKLPEFKPILNTIVVDETGRLWVEMERVGNADRHWVAYNSQGKKVGDVRFSWDYRLVSATDKHIILEHTSQDEFKAIEVHTLSMN